MIIQIFSDTIHDIVNRGGRCLIPVFALGRAQELLLILGKDKVTFVTSLSIKLSTHIGIHDRLQCGLVSQLWMNFIK